MEKSKNKSVKLTCLDGNKHSTQFPIEQANALLGLSNSRWKLDDSAFEFNGTELAPKGKK